MSLSDSQRESDRPIFNPIVLNLERANSPADGGRTAQSEAVEPSLRCLAESGVVGGHLLPERFNPPRPKYLYLKGLAPSVL